MLVALIAFTFRDYAISNDEEVQQHYGALIVAYYASGFADQALFHFRDLYLYGGLFDVVAVGLEKILPLDTYAVRHLLSAFIGVGGIGAAWATARAIGGPRAGLLAAAALAVCGIWYGAMFAHTKDIPFAAAMMGAFYFLLHLGRELPRPRWHLVLLFGVLCGCALGIRVLGIFAIGYAGITVLAYTPIGRGGSRPAALAFVVRSSLTLVPAFVIAYIIMIAASGHGPVWRRSIRCAPSPRSTSFIIRSTRSWTVTCTGWPTFRAWYVPSYVCIKLTLLLLIGASLALLLATIPRFARHAAGAAWRKETALVAVAAFLRSSATW